MANAHAPSSPMNSAFRAGGLLAAQPGQPTLPHDGHLLNGSPTYAMRDPAQKSKPFLGFALVAPSLRLA